MNPRDTWKRKEKILSVFESFISLQKRYVMAIESNYLLYFGLIFVVGIILVVILFYFLLKLRRKILRRDLEDVKQVLFRDENDNENRRSNEDKI